MTVGVRLRFDAGTVVLDGELDAFTAAPVADFVADERIGGRLRAPAVAYRAALGDLIRRGVDVQDEARGYEELNLKPTRVRQPFPHQREALEAWFEGKRRGVVVLPTGSGKSYVAEMAIASTGRSTLVVVPTIDLLNQWVWNLRSAFGDACVGAVGGGLYDVKPLTVTTYDSAYIHMARFGDRFGLLVFDECHHLPGPAYAQSAQMAIAPFRLGLTATPERSDGEETQYSSLIGPVVYRRGIHEMAGDILADYEVVRLAVALSEPERLAYETARATYRSFVAFHRIRMSENGGWQRFIALSSRSSMGREAWQAWREQKRIALQSDAKFTLLEELLCQHQTEQVIVFTADNETVYTLSRRYLMPAITHQTKTEERQWILQQFNACRLRAVVTSKVLNEGVDMPAASVGIILSGSSSVREHVQRLGRILRRGEGKQAVLYEVVSTDTNETYMSERRRDHHAYR
jgi:superfamily II DNA or RNA helicase